MLRRRDPSQGADSGSHGRTGLISSLSRADNYRPVNLCRESWSRRIVHRLLAENPLNPMKQFGYANLVVAVALSQKVGVKRRGVASAARHSLLPGLPPIVLRSRREASGSPNIAFPSCLLLKATRLALLTVTVIVTETHARPPPPQLEVSVGKSLEDTCRMHRRDTLQVCGKHRHNLVAMAYL